MKVSLKKWALNILLSIDQFGNAVTFGSPDRTISARIGVQKREGRLNWFTRPLDKFLEWLDPGHSLDAAHTEEHGGHDAAFKDWVDPAESHTHADDCNLDDREIDDS